MRKRITARDRAAHRLLDKLVADGVKASVGWPVGQAGRGKMWVIFESEADRKPVPDRWETYQVLTYIEPKPEMAPPPSDWSA